MAITRDFLRGIPLNESVEVKATPAEVANARTTASQLMRLYGMTFTINADYTDGKVTITRTT